VITIKLFSKKAADGKTIVMENIIGPALRAHGLVYSIDSNAHVIKVHLTAEDRQEIAEGKRGKSGD